MLLLRAIHPAAWTVCGFRWLTGIECPLCGLTHGLCALARGEVAEAVAWNALAPLALVMLAALFWPGRLRSRMWRAGVPAFAVYGVWRVGAGLLR